jgi:hypothetical protein
MQEATDEASIPTGNVSNDSPAIRTTGMICKVGTRTVSWSYTADTNLVLPPPSPPPQPTQKDGDLPVAKGPRLWTSSADWVSTAGADSYPDYSDEQSIADLDKYTSDARSIVEEDHADEQRIVDAATPNVSRTHALTMAASLLKDATSRAPIRKWTPEEDAELTKAVKKHGSDFVAVAALLHGRTKGQCQGRWDRNCSPSAVAAPTHTKGKWTPEEDAKLIEAVQMLGKKWAPVAALVHGRTTIQCRTHWKHNFELAFAKTKAHSIGRCKPEDDANLAEAGNKHDNHCVAVAALVHGRTNKYYTWTTNVDPSVVETTPKNIGEWTPEEDATLIKAVKQFGKNYSAIAALIPGRSNKQVRYRWNCKLDPNAVVAPVKETQILRKWKPEEDALLTEGVKKYGTKWVPIAALVPGRTNAQCRSRWHRHLDARNRNQGRWTPEEDSLLTAIRVAALIPGPPNEKCHDKSVETYDVSSKDRLGKGKWTHEEDALLTEGVKRHGANWVPIAALVPGRTNFQCSSRWLRQLDPSNGNKGPWIPEEDAMLYEAVGKVGKDWAAVAALIPGRRNEQCRDRWVRCLDISSREAFEKGAWTPEEDAKLTEAVQKIGVRRWAAVAALVCTRSNKQCRHRWMDYLDPGIVRTQRRKSKATTILKSKATTILKSKATTIL